MTVQLAPPPSAEAMIPASAPFSDEQRAWLNGFFAGLLSLDAKAGASALEGALPGAAAKALAGEDDGAPWHDAAMPIAERMSLAEGKPLPRRLFAAMAQQDCGQCGYLCETYSKAIAEGTGGQAQPVRPRRQGDEPHAEAAAGGDAAPAAGTAVVEAKRPAGPRPPRPRPAPASAPVEAIFRSAPPASTARARTRTRAMSCSTSPPAASPTCPATASASTRGTIRRSPRRSARALRVPPDFRIGDKPIRDALIEDYALGVAPDALFELMSLLVGGERRRKAKALATGEDPDGDAATLDVLAVLEKFAPVHPDPEAFLECLEPLQPRLYSIASSPLRHAGRAAPDRRCGALRRSPAGSARALPPRFSPTASSPARASRPTSRRRTASPCRRTARRRSSWSAPAPALRPFRSFLWHRKAAQGHGSRVAVLRPSARGHRLLLSRRACGIPRRWHAERACRRRGRATAPAKVYVQDRMREAGPELWTWLKDGAHFYVCGDAKRMAKDVENALIEISAKAGQMSEAAAPRLHRRAEGRRAATRRTCTDGAPLPAHFSLSPPAGRGWGEERPIRCCVRTAPHPNLPHTWRRGDLTAAPQSAPRAPIAASAAACCATPDGKGGAAIRGDPAHPANFGRLCSKGSALGETLGLETRLLHPLVDGAARELGRRARSRRRPPAGHLQPRTAPRRSPSTSPGQLLTEDYYVANKLAKGFIGTPHVDTNSRLCMASSVAGHRRAFGADVVPQCYEDLELADLVVLAGSNAAWCHPILYQRIQIGARRARRARRQHRPAPHRHQRGRRPAALAQARQRRRPVVGPAGVRSPSAALSTASSSRAHTQGFEAALARAREIAPTLARRRPRDRPRQSRRRAVLRLVRRHPARASPATARASTSRRRAPTRSTPSSTATSPRRASASPAPDRCRFTGQPNAMGGREVGGLANMLAAHMGFSAERARPRAPLLGGAQSRRPARASRPSTCSMPSPTAASRPCG